MTMTSLESPVLEPASFDAQALKKAFAQYPSGITVVTTTTPLGPVGFTCQAFHSVSLEPPLVSFLVMNTSTTYPAIRAAGRFAVNILSEQQAGVAMQFAKSGDRFAGIGWEPGRTGSPLLADCLVAFDCELEAEYEAGDHLIVIGRVVGLTGTADDADPLVYFRSAFGRVAR